MFRSLTFALTLLVSASVFSQTADHEPSEKTNGRIAWTLFSPNGGGIFSVGPTGLHEIQVTIPGPSVDNDFHPSWSPDGRRLVFTQANLVAQPLGRQAVFVANVDGSAMHRITPWALDATDADWSPDGTRISCHFPR